MADETVVIDPNDVRRHAKRMYTEAEYRKLYRRIDFYKPNRFQLKLHNAPANVRYINARAANQLGKSTAAAMQLAMDAMGYYPSWYTGRKFLKPPPIIRSYDFQAFIASIQSYVLRDGIARALVGDLSQGQSGLGTGAIPLDMIAEKITYTRGISDLFDTVVLNREVGGRAAIQTRTFDAGRRAFQALALDEVFLDEDDPGLAEIFGEVWARLTTTSGRIVFTATAIIGNSYMQQLCAEEGHPERMLIVGDLSDADHLTVQEIADLEAGYPEDEREARVHGGIRLGSGRIFTFNRKEVECQIDPATLEFNSAWLWSLDLPHSAGKTAHPFSGVLFALCRDNDTLYILDAFKMAASAMPTAHSDRINSALDGAVKGVPVAWPRDGTITEANTGNTLMTPYRKHLNVMKDFSKWPDGGVSHEASISEVQRRLFSGRLKIQSHLGDLMNEMANYHRDEKGTVVRMGDDMVSALLCGVRSLWQAKRLDELSVESGGAQYMGYDPITGEPVYRGNIRPRKRRSGVARLDPDAGDKYFGIDA